MKKLSLILVLLSFSSTVFAAGACRSFLLNVMVAGSDITFSKVCTSETESIMAMSVALNGSRVIVDSGTLSSPEVDVKASITKRVTEGISLDDANAIINQINPALARKDLGAAKMALIDLILTK